MELVAAAIFVLDVRSCSNFQPGQLSSQVLQRLERITSQTEERPTGITNTYAHTLRYILFLKQYTKVDWITWVDKQYWFIRIVIK